MALFYTLAQILSDKRVFGTIIPPLAFGLHSSIQNNGPAMQRYVLLFFCFFAILQATAQVVWVSPCTDRTFCFDAGNCSGGTVVLWETAVTGCGNPSINYSYRLDIGNNGSVDVISSDDTVNMVLPAGTHLIVWRAVDNCGSVNQGCSYLITVKDCTPPSLLCINGLAQNLVSPECEVTFDVQDFILLANDNCTPANALEFGIRLSGNGVGFPTDTSLTFGVCQQGQYPVQIWVRDENGLANACNSYVLVQENAGLCVCNESAEIRLHGCAHNADSARLAEYTVRADMLGLPLQGPAIGDTTEQNPPDSCFTIAFPGLPLNGTYSGSVRAQRSGDPLDGVSTFDLVLINRHILGQQPLKNFYHVLAADVNESNSVSTFDIIEIRKLILGIYDTFPQTTTWRFIRPVPDPLNLAAFAEVRDTYAFSVPNLLSDTLLSRFDFVGVKMGDANANATLHDLVPEDRTAPLVLLCADNRLEAGAEYWVDFRLSEAAELDGWQLALQADARYLEIRDVRGVPPQFVALHPSGDLRLSCLADVPQRLSPDDVLFSVLVTAKKTVRVSDVLYFNDARLAPEAYPAGETAVRSLALRLGKPSSGTVFSAPQPNPFVGETVFPVELPHAQEVLLEIFDLTGSVVYRAAYRLGAGRQAVVLPGGQLPAGVFAYRIRAGGAVRSGRLVRG